MQSEREVIFVCLFLFLVRLFGVREFLLFLFQIFVAWIDIQVPAHALLTLRSLACLVVTTTYRSAIDIWPILK